MDEEKTHAPCATVNLNSCCDENYKKQTVDSFNFQLSMIPNAVFWNIYISIVCMCENV